jgi:hypothetical protein
MNKLRLGMIERYILEFFQQQQRTRVLARELFDSNAEFANADLVRALEDLEKRGRFLVRHTTDGNDYVSLTPDGATELNLTGLVSDTPQPHPPKSATKRLS